MSKPAKKFNWLTTLRRLAKRKTLISDTEHRELSDLSWKWPTCACGQLCVNLPRSISGAPLDYILKTEGVEFTLEVEAAKWKEALATFLRIEARATLLLKQMAEAEAA